MKLSLLLKNVFSAVFLILLLPLVVTSFTHSETFGFSLVFFCMISVCVLVALVACKDYFSFLNNLSAKKTVLIFCLMLCLTFVVQVNYAIDNHVYPTADFEAIFTGAKEAIGNGLKLTESNTYFLWYPFNRGALFFQIFTDYATYKIFGVLPGSVIANNIVNIICINVGITFTFLCAKKIYGNFISLVMSVMLFLFLPYYAMIPYFYSHTYCFPFISASLFFLVKYFYATSTRQRLISLIASGVFCATAAILYSTGYVLTVGFLIFILLNSKHKSALINFGVFAVSLAVVLVCFQTLVNISGIIDFTLAEQEGFPATYWIYTGLISGDGGGVGVFSEQAFQLMKNASSLTERTEIMNALIFERLNELKLSGILQLFYTKHISVWSSPLYLAPIGIPGFYNEAINCLLFILMPFSVIKDLTLKKLSPLLAGKIAVFGLMLLLMLSESRGFYKFGFSGILLLTSLDGVIFIKDIVFLKLLKNKNRK